MTKSSDLEMTLEAASLGSRARLTVGGETHVIERVPGGWYLPGDLVITSGDVADGQPEHLELDEEQA